MGNKINPLAMRPEFSQCQWFTTNKRHFAINILKDYKIRSLAEDVIGIRLFVNINIERIGEKTNIVINTHKPSAIIMSKNGKDPLVETYKKKLNEKVFENKPFQVLISEVHRTETNCTVIAHNIAEQLEMRASTKSCMKKAVNQFLRSVRNGGIKIICKGRINGAEIARIEKIQEGKMPLASIKCEIKMYNAVAHTVYGTVSVKVFTYIPKDMDFKKYDNKDKNFFRKVSFNKNEKKYIKDKDNSVIDSLGQSESPETLSGDEENKGDL
jgi:small subunit ribosomal protein S3